MIKIVFCRCFFDLKCSFEINECIPSRRLRGVEMLNEMKMLHILKKYITDHAEFDYFYVPSTIFQLCRGGSSLVEPVLS